jgi:hypothetical protein
MKIKHNPNTMFVYPITEDELNPVVSKLKGKSATSFDQIPKLFCQRMCSVHQKAINFYI